MITAEIFQFFQRYLRERLGFNLIEAKKYLIDTRLGRIIRERGLAGVEALAEALRRNVDPELDRQVMEAMTTNETYFFRDRTPFEAMRTKLLPELIAARQTTKRLAIWCAACSTGQEPYSIAMILDEMRAELRDWTIDIVATDVAASVVERARSGTYSQFEVQRGLPIRQLLAHFEKVGDAEWRISERMRAKVRFRTLNLLRDFGALGRFDLIFCRNVLIYFDQATRQSVVTRMSRQIANDGALVLGAAETVIGLATDLVSNREMPGVYRSASHAARLASVA